MIQLLTKKKCRDLHVRQESQFLLQSVEITWYHQHSLSDSNDQMEVPA